MIRAIVNFFKRKATHVEAVVMNDSRTYRFEKWEDAIPYIGKPVRVCMVESPDITGYLTGISVVISEGKIIKGFLEVNHHRWDHWKCQPDFKAIKNPALFRVCN